MIEDSSIMLIEGNVWFLPKNCTIEFCFFFDGNTALFMSINPIGYTAFALLKLSIGV